MRDLKVHGALLGHRGRGSTGGRNLLSGYMIKDLASSCTVEFLFLCFPLLMSIKFHYTRWFLFFLVFFFSSVGFWFALQIQFQSETWAARLPHDRDETHGDFCLRLKYS